MKCDLEDEEAMKCDRKVIREFLEEGMKYDLKVIEDDRLQQVANELDVTAGYEFHIADGEEHDYRPEVLVSIGISPWEWAKLKASRHLYEVTSQDEVDRFYQEMSKEVETLLHERDQSMLPEELSRSVVVTCVSDGGTCDVFVLQTKQRSQESCREIEVKSMMTYVLPQVVSVRHPGNPHEGLTLHRNYKVVNKLEVSPGQESRVAFKEAMKYGGKVTLLRTWVMQPWEKIMFIVASLLCFKELLFLEVPSKKLAISTVRMLSALCVAVSGVVTLSGIYFGWKIRWITFGD
ncbi:uncharacterized protein LOC130139142 [Syzygium oleosum]|uniref:uncharacterized protein LOC130139142 n=1 Tax=Syzygium oleosum TaxID=219896 RepID=UPI0024B8D804|nr:uncharacterized protein LOC130139142 [Syzygium oleosum]